MTLPYTSIILCIVLTAIMCHHIDEMKFFSFRSPGKIGDCAGDSCSCKEPKHMTYCEFTKQCQSCERYDFTVCHDKAKGDGRHSYYQATCSRRAKIPDTATVAPEQTKGKHDKKDHQHKDHKKENKEHKEEKKEHKEEHKEHEEKHEHKEEHKEHKEENNEHNEHKQHHDDNDNSISPFEVKKNACL